MSTFLLSYLVTFHINSFVRCRIFCIFVGKLRYYDIR